jgi:predicted RecB family nuclease
VNVIKNISTISKTSFIRGLQCPRSFYLYKYCPDLRDRASEELQYIFRAGSEVGILARDLFPGGIDASPDDRNRLQESTDLTRRLIEEGKTIIYEAGFMHENLFCSIDILVQDKDKWKGYEVKSSTGISSTYIMDASFQYHVIRSSGLPLEEINLVHINNRYRRKGELDLNSLFTIKPVTSDAVLNDKIIKEVSSSLSSIAANSSDPCTETGEHCFRPYICNFMGYCWGKFPDNSVFSISGLNKSEAINLYKSGIKIIEDIPHDYPLTPAQKIQVECHRNNREHVNCKKLTRFIENLKYPLCFLDFEAIMDAVPRYHGTRPYRHIPFQYSLHIQETPGSEPGHCSFLGNPKEDPRREFIESLLENINTQGDILVYNKPYENGRLKELARDFPQYSHKIKKVTARLKDLMKPFQNRHYYNPRMKGSYSLKNILPALVPELSYEGMDVSNGFEAMRTYSSMRTMTDMKSINGIREDLLEYCKLDTLGMVRIVERLREIISS